MKNNINVIKWPAYRPDLSPMENLWGILARSVFQNGKQYATVKDLEAAVDKCWAKVSLRTIQKLIDSMPDRICAIVLSSRKKAKKLTINYFLNYVSLKFCRCAL